LVDDGGADVGDFGALGEPVDDEGVEGIGVGDGDVAAPAAGRWTAMAAAATAVYGSNRPVRKLTGGPPLLR
jgi:hypothetical protein